MRLALEQRNAVVATVRRKMQNWYDGQPRRNLHPIGYYCHWWAFHTMMVMREAGLKGAQLQAGTAYWPIQTKETDDGVWPTRFGYEFDHKAAVKHLAHGGHNPEMHVWVAIAQEPVEMVDLTAPFFKTRAIETGMRFAAPDPPDYFWNEGTELPDGVVYRADMHAIELAYSLLKSEIHGTPLYFPTAQKVKAFNSARIV